MIAPRAVAMDHFDVYVTGFEVPDDRAVQGLVQVFGMGEATARNFVQSLPRMGKRNQPADAAERYVRALRAIGGVAQVRASENRASVAPAGPAGDRKPITSLPPPAARLSEIARQWGIDLEIPAIPRAANLPAELIAQTAPQRASTAPPQPQPTAAPSWIEPSPADAVRQATASVPAPTSLRSPEQPSLLDAAAAPALDTPALHESVAGSRSKWPPRPDHVGRVERRVSLPAPAEPGLSMRARVSIVLGLGLLLVVGAGFERGWFETETDRLRAAFERDGIEGTGEVIDAERFLRQTGHTVRGIDSDRLQTLLDGLTRAGVTHIWAVDVRGQGAAQVAGGLVFELPSDPAARSTAYFQHVRAAAPDAPQPTETQRFMRLVF